MTTAKTRVVAALRKAVSNAQKDIEAMSAAEAQGKAKMEKCGEMKKDKIPDAPKPPMMAKTTVAEVNKELNGKEYKSIASNPTAMPKLPGLGRKLGTPVSQVNKEMGGFKSLVKEEGCPSCGAKKDK
jgi:hypothetical protein